MRSLGIACAALVVLAGAACEASGEALPPALEPSEVNSADSSGTPAADDAIFFPTWSADARPLAIVAGTLVERKGCLLLESRGHHTLLLWEEGYSYSDRALRDPSGKAIAKVGQRLHGGGGYGSDWNHAERVIGQKVPRRCRPAGDEPFALIYDVRRGPPA